MMSTMDNILTREQIELTYSSEKFSRDFVHPPEMSHRDEYRQWPFLNEEEFDLACAYFDQRYVKAKLGPTRQIFKIRSRRTATTGTSYIEIIRLLQLPEDQDEFSLALGRLCASESSLSGGGMDLDTMNEDTDEVGVCIPNEFRFWIYVEVTLEN